MKRMRSNQSNYGAVNQEEPAQSQPTSKSWKPTLLTHDELSPWRHDNEFVLTGYRPDMVTYTNSLKSLFYLHNESVNIWTHLLGACVALLVLLLFVLSTGSGSAGRLSWKAPFHGVYPFPSSNDPTVTWKDSIGFVIFFLSAFTCLGISAGFHTLSAHSMIVAHRWNRFDYIGIVVLISGTFVPLIFYGFFCAPKLQQLYLTLIGIASAFTVAVVLAPHARTPEYRRFRTFVFIGLGLSAVFPVGHGVVRYGLSAASAAIALPWLALGGALYIVGALTYAERCPERFIPTKFDFFGSSHQIFHVLILLAAWAHWTAICEAFRFWHGELNGICSSAYR